MKRQEAHAATMLRLVNTHDAPARRTPHAHNTQRTATPNPTHRPSARPTVSPTRQLGLTADDPRWVFAARVASQLEGGHAAVLRPERRERLTKTAKLLGLRAFDAALVIALVQDATRRGETRPGYPALTPSIAARLECVPKPLPEPAPPAWLGRLAAACLFATGLVAMAILWINGA